MAVNQGISLLFLCPSHLWLPLCLMRMMASWIFSMERIWRYYVCVFSHPFYNYPGEKSSEKEQWSPNWRIFLFICWEFIETLLLAWLNPMDEFKWRHWCDPSYPEGADNPFFWQEIWIRNSGIIAATWCKAEENRVPPHGPSGAYL